MSEEAEEAEEAEEDIRFLNEDADTYVRYGCPQCLSVFRLGFSRCPIDGGVLQKIADDPLVGTTIADRYLIEECIGEGGMGRVYRARHQRVSRLFAIKVLFGDFATDPKMRARFSHEAEAASRLSHANVISVMDFGETREGLLYLAMDFVEGPELRELVCEEGPFAAERVRNIVRQLCHGLAHAHEEGLVHRDFKSENVIVAQRGDSEIPRIVDFGIAVMLEGAGERLTTQGIIVGTPATMSPEQMTGQEIDARSDLFSLGVVMYEMLAGVAPFSGDAMSMARQNLSANPPPIIERVPGLEVNEELEKIARRLMEKRPEDRYQSAQEVIDAIDTNVGSSASIAAPKVRERTGPAITDMLARSRRRHPALLMIAMGLLLLGAVIGGFLFFGRTGSATTAADQAATVQDAGPAGKSAMLSGSTDAAPLPVQAMHMQDAAAAAQTNPPKPGTQEPPPKGPRPTSPVKADAAVSEPGNGAVPGRHDAAPKAAAPDNNPEPPSSTALTKLYVEVGKSLELLRNKSPERYARLRTQYSNIPFNDALRVPALRGEVETKLKRLSRTIKTGNLCTMKNKNTFRAVIFLVVVSATLTCASLDNIDVDANGQTTIEGNLLGSLLGPLSFVGFDGIDISESQAFKNQGYTKDEIDSVRLKVFTLSVSDPQDGNFDFLNNVSFFAEADGLSKVEIARLNPVPDGATVLEMEILDVELLDYAVADSMTITTEATGVTPEQDTTIDAAVVLDVDINIDGSLGCSVAAHSRQ